MSMKNFIDTIGNRTRDLSPQPTAPPLPPINKVKKIKIKASRNSPGVAQRVPGDLGYQISMTFGT
jgi:hypothetical protein